MNINLLNLNKKEFSNWYIPKKAQRRRRVDSGSNCLGASDYEANVHSSLLRGRLVVKGFLDEQNSFTVLFSALSVLQSYIGLKTFYFLRVQII